jgi:hypothetical protein
MKWIIYDVLNLIMTVVCYLTNWIVCLFANEVGDLPGFLMYWQTWDDSCDVDFFVKEKAPKIFRYDFDKHYKSSRQTTPELSKYNRDRGCVILIDPNFSVKERIQRYFCRVLWLTRNNEYGFAFYLFGVSTEYKNLVKVKNTYDPTTDERTIIYYDGSVDLWNRPWIVAINKHIIGNMYLDIFLGWKLSYYDSSISGPTRSMIANRIEFQFQ